MSKALAAVERLADAGGIASTQLKAAFYAAPPGASSADATVAFALAERGDIDAAATRLEAASHNSFRDMPADAGWPMAVGMWSEVAAMAADQASAAALHDVAEPWDGLQLATGGITTGPTARHLARLETVLDRPGDTDRHFAESIEHGRSLASPVSIARCCLDWAEALADHNEKVRAGTRRRGEHRDRITFAASPPGSVRDPDRASL